MKEQELIKAIAIDIANAGAVFALSEDGWAVESKTMRWNGTDSGVGGATVAYQTYIGKLPEKYVIDVEAE